jgi:hypothetical protein
MVRFGRAAVWKAPFKSMALKNAPQTLVERCLNFLNSVLRSLAIAAVIQGKLNWWD